MSKKVALIALSIVLVAALVGGATMAWFTNSAASDPVEFTAGTVLIEAGSSSIASQYFDPVDGIFVYGEIGNSGDLYEIDVKNQVENRIFENPKTYSGYYPNGLAFDEVNDRLYFAANKNDLYYYDFSADELVNAGKFPQTGKDVYGATFGGGYFWYVPNDTADLYKVTFDNEGKIAGSSHVTMTENTGLQFGDIVIDYAGGIIYGSSTSFYFTYDTVTGEFKNLGRAGRDLQLAWGHDGVLYGHNTTSRNWYSVVPDTGTPAKLFTGEYDYNDLAPGSKSYWNPGDCAWAKFNVKNVGTKNSYVRLLLGGKWQEKTDDGWVDWPPPAGDDMVTFTSAGASWIAEGGYLYYNAVLEPGEIAELSLSVCFSTDAGNDFQGKRFVVTGGLEAIQT
ncbi:MAG: hypothetical protein GX825_06115, partial [Syntrophomonadaceae bacterium]|nr:hypothetical protein [Syntrophomonadaceae bacterium]